MPGLTSYYFPLAVDGFAADTTVAEGYSTTPPPASFVLRDWRRGVRLLPIANGTTDVIALSLRIVDLVEILAVGSATPTVGYLTRTIGTVTFANTAGAMTGPTLNGVAYTFCDNVTVAWVSDAYLTARLNAGTPVAGVVETFNPGGGNRPAEIIFSNLLNAWGLAFQVDYTAGGGTRWNFMIAQDA